MKSILISIQPKWCELIASGKKTIEVRKTRPKIETPFKCYIYQTKKRWIYNLFPLLKERQSKVIGEFVCDKFYLIKAQYYDHGSAERTPDKLIYIYGIDDNKFLFESCISYQELFDYTIKNDGFSYGWQISDLKIYDNPKELREFCTWRFGKNDGCDTCFNKKWWEGDTADENIAKRICAPCQKDNFRKQITRPPQSWCYVEELQ